MERANSMPYSTFTQGEFPQYQLRIDRPEDPGGIALPLILPTGSKLPKPAKFEKSTLLPSHVLLRLSNQSRILKHVALSSLAPPRQVFGC